MEKTSKSKPPGHRALRRGRASPAGQTCLVTFATHYRARLFLNPYYAMSLCRSLHGLTLWKDSRLLAWVLMPDHLHLLISLAGTESLQGLVRKLKSNTARELRRRYPEIGRVWALAFHDRAIRREHELKDVARYLVLNPVRAGLVKSVRQYPYWNAIWI